MFSSKARRHPCLTAITGLTHSSPLHPTAGGACIGVGIGPHNMQNIFGVVKAYSTRVGCGGPFPTELPDETGDYLRNTAHEFGTVTGRPRRIGWLDTRAVRYAAELNSSITSRSPVWIFWMIWKRSRSARATNMKARKSKNIRLT